MLLHGLQDQVLKLPIIRSGLDGGFSGGAGLMEVEEDIMAHRAPFLISRPGFCRCTSCTRFSGGFSHSIAATPVIPLPQKGSRTMSPGSV